MYINQLPVQETLMVEYIPKEVLLSTVLQKAVDVNVRSTDPHSTISFKLSAISGVTKHASRRARFG